MQIPKITESAKQHINKICKDYDVFAVSLNLKGGGCAGYEYEWQTVEKDSILKEDTVISTGSGNLVIGSFSTAFLERTEIDYVTEMLGSKLTINNPNVQSSCGCGESIGF